MYSPTTMWGIHLTALCSLSRWLPQTKIRCASAAMLFSRSIFIGLRKMPMRT